MSGFRFSARSLANLEGVHPDLAALAHAALARSEVDFAVTEGARPKERQRELVAAGASRTLNSMHLNRHTELPGGRTEALAYAIDVAAIVGGQARWDWPLYHKIKAAFDRASEATGIRFQWGGDWRSFPDGPHFQLHPDDYAAMRASA
ncbi:MAG: M15 family metallopeptidase [Maricaulaceae bacterium]|nr:M15 family metallopeptidase [Maricaulaceae bacterium]